MFALLLLVACSSVSDAKPALPASISPGWSLQSLDRQQGAASPICWRAAYRGAGTADVSVCRYGADAGALDAVQRAHPEAQTVKFQEGANFVEVHWANAQKADIEALVRAIQRALKS